jgi:pimeloyl-ACP methyl ester carboxylesterase
MTRHVGPRAAVFTGAAGNRLVADVFGESGSPVLLLHGGGQTRHSWRETGRRLAAAGSVAYALDQRGHGDSDWIADGNYAFIDFADDAVAVADALAGQAERAPVAVGASLGGIAALLAEGAGAQIGRPVFSALVLVDIAPRVDAAGVAKIQGFMRANAKDGFGSIAEAADAVAAYLPHRPRPPSYQGLKKNLRLGPDGRWRWHWDPRFLDGPRPIGTGRGEIEAALVAAAQRVTVPVMLVRGGSSEVVTENHVREFLDLVPHAEYMDVAGARHMVAGDRNDRFSAAILGFLGKLGLSPQADCGPGSWG